MKKRSLARSKAYGCGRESLLPKWSRRSSLSRRGTGSISSKRKSSAWQWPNSRMGRLSTTLPKTCRICSIPASPQKGMIVVERQKLEEVLREQKIAYTGIIDLATAAQVGKLLGVEGMVVGSVADLGNSVAL